MNPSLCNLCVLCVSVVNLLKNHHRDTEDTEVAQRTVSNKETGMRLSVIFLGFVCLCAVVIGVAAPAQDDDVRGAFLTSRPKEKPASSGAAIKPNRRRPKQPAGSINPASTSKSPEKNPPHSGTSGTPSTPSASAKPVNNPRIGL